MDGLGFKSCDEFQKRFEYKSFDGEMQSTFFIAESPICNRQSPPESLSPFNRAGVIRDSSVALDSESYFP